MNSLGIFSVRDLVQILARIHSRMDLLTNGQAPIFTFPLIQDNKEK
jgi:hypothetical protein